jgi:hypothetical protein
MLLVLCTYTLASYGSEMVSIWLLLHAESFSYILYAASFVESNGGITQVFHRIRNVRSEPHQFQELSPPLLE